MVDEKVILEKIIRINRNTVSGIHERFNKIDFEIGRRVAVIEINTDSLVKTLDTLGKELREQYYSLGRRIDLLEMQVIKYQNEQGLNNTQVTSKGILSMIENLENEERWNLLNEMYDFYYNKDESIKGIPLDLDY
ncbi:hypothetical protein S3E15_01831 [Bacillus mycoides]|uniref:Uncharacterized protein n=1 Tax=Bacillus mycoides TaxID=1405 RepID=A0AAP8BD92_BACMY|nr:hypothetical protein [Bacillus mycoides]OSX90267.1 hypothetical protein S3E15_01831 [Bacillus mycoides]